MEEQRFTVESEGGSVVRILWSPGIVLRESDARALATGLLRALPGRRPHVLMFLNGMMSLSQDALAHIARQVPLSAISLVGPSVLDQILVELYLEIYEPPFPVGYFELEAAARAWLARQPALT